MQINAVKAILNKEEVFLVEQNGLYNYDDISVCILNNANVKITSKKTAVSFLKIEFKYNLPVNSVLLGDAWERAYADLSFKAIDANIKMPWYFIAFDGEINYAFGVKTQPNTFCYWQCEYGKLTLTIDMRNGSLPLCLNGRTLEACTVVTERYNGDTFDALIRFCKKMCDNPRLPNRLIYGGNDWYCNYGNNSFEKILTHAKRIVECSPKGAEKPFMVIDDGWQLCHQPTANFNGGPWKYANENFKDMGKMADAIKEAGAIPGIWFRPLLTAEKLPEHYVLKRKGIEITLDPSVPEVLAKVAEDIKQIVSWGYKLIKHDFSTFDIFGIWGFMMQEDMTRGELLFADKTKTTAEIIKNMYLAMREAAGEEVMIMGCNTVSHLSAEIFELQRTGDDTSGVDWERTRNYGVNTLAFRMCQHNTFYCVDADCVGITDKIDWQKNKQWLDVLSKSGTPLFVSIAEDAYTDEIKADITVAFSRAAVNSQISKPIDWMKNNIPAKWESRYGKDIYNW